MFIVISQEEDTVLASHGPYPSKEIAMQAAKEFAELEVARLGEDPPGDDYHAVVDEFESGYVVDEEVSFYVVQLEAPR